MLNLIRSNRKSLGVKDAVRSSSLADPNTLNLDPDSEQKLCLIWNQVRIQGYAVNFDFFLNGNLFFKFFFKFNYKKIMAPEELFSQLRL